MIQEIPVNKIRAIIAPIKIDSSVFIISCLVYPLSLGLVLFDDPILLIVILISKFCFTFFFQKVFGYLGMAKFIQVKLRSGEEISLTEREQLFIEYYLGECNKNATQACLKAGYSPKTATNIANQNLGKLHIQKVIQDRTAPVLEAIGATTDRILREWAELALSRPLDGLNKNSNIPLGYQDSHTFKKLQIDGMEVDSHEKQVSFNYAQKVQALKVVSEYLGIIDRTKKEPAQQPLQQNFFYTQINNGFKE